MNRRQLHRDVSRRDFLVAAAAATGGVIGGDAFARATPEAPVAFFLVGDTHYLADKQSPDKVAPRSADVTSALIETLNTLPGTALPDSAGGGKVAAPRGVIHAGDLIDTGDKNGPVALQMQRTEWAAFTQDFGATGTDGRLKYPVYEVHGNHDSPRGDGLVIEGIRERNRRRPGLVNVSPNGLHYSWNWGDVHFINLGIVVGQVRQVTQARRYHPLDSLDFLVSDLKEQVRPGQGVVITHHVDVARYTGACDPQDVANLNKEWNPCDVRGFHEAIRHAKILAILYGHTHARNILRWDGQSTKTTEGISLLNVDNGSHFNDDRQAFFYVEITSSELLVRECATADRWRSHQWTPQVWRRAISG